MRETVIELKNLSVHFDGRPVLNKVDLSVREGECLVLVGPSGQGKTTLLKTMAGLVDPQDGELRIKNENLQTTNSAKRLELIRSMGMLFQKNALFDSLTCAENIAFPLRETTKLSEELIQKKVEQFLEAVGLSHAGGLFPSEISGGMQKRLGIARALALRPSLIFYDDPTAGLDPITSKKIIELILKMKTEDRSTVVAVTNDMRRAYQMADRIAYVGDGEVLVTGNPQQTKDCAD
ncbi:MAG: ATP-binding cassette domain-containing protein, partial [Bdellovibrionaceae bacterium]|nr:ATP-binding cassette domain-containing protein [Pseudobdellovibrionaceae bacterium]